MAEPVRARRLTDLEGQQLQQIVRRGKHGSVRVRRAMIIMASASGTPVPAIARLVAADEDTVRDVIHPFNEKGLAALDPQWAGGRPRLISDEDIEFIVTTATTRPEKLGRPFTHWSVRKLAGYLAGNTARTVVIGRERLRQILAARPVLPADPDVEGVQRPGQGRQAGPDRVRDQPFPGPVLRVRPVRAVVDPPGSRRRPGRGSSKPDRLPATYHRTHGIRYFHGCYSLGDDKLWGVNRRRKGGDHTLAALKSIRATMPGGAPIYVILDNLSANKTPAIRNWARARQGRAVLHPDQRVLGQPDRGPVRAAADVHHGRLGPPQPHRPGPETAGLPELAQRQRPPPRRPGRPTTRTRPHPLRTPATLGTTQDQSRLTQTGERSWSAH